jgi:GNAT superfamily N-acetyltransferase
MPLKLEIRRLSQADRCPDFCSGNDSLDNFFRRYAKKHDARKLSATFVASANDKIVGFVTTVPFSVPAMVLKSHVNSLPSYPATVLLLARMATDVGFQKRGVGAQPLREVVFARTMALADDFGCVGLYVDPKPEAVGFYAKYGFVSLLHDAVPPPMFLSLGTIRSAMTAPSMAAATADVAP